MAKAIAYKLVWMNYKTGDEFQVDQGWEVSSVVMMTQTGVLLLLRGIENAQR